MTLIPAFKIGVWNAWIFMIWPWLYTLALRLVSKEAFQRASGASEMKTSLLYKIVSYISMLVDILAILYSIFLPFQLGTMRFYVGLAIFSLGLSVMTIGSVNFASTPINVPVTRGIYRYSRHPLYLASLLICLSVSIASASWIFLLVFFVQLVPIKMAAFEEERFCLDKYGNAYREYVNKIPRWIGIPKSG